MARKTKLDELREWATAHTFNDYRGGPEVVDIDELTDKIDELIGTRKMEKGSAVKRDSKNYNKGQFLGSYKKPKPKDKKDT
jgi:hypothetical protein